MKHPVVEAPEGISDTTFRNVVGAAYTAWMIEKEQSIEVIAKYCNHQVRTISKVVGTEQYRRAMSIRGVPVRNEHGLSAEQVLCINAITDASDRADLRTRLKRVGVSHSQYKAWLRQPQFRHAVTNLGESNLTDHLPSVLTALTNKATSGDVNAAKFLLEVSGRHDPTRRQAMDVQSVLMQVIEIITRNVTDKEVLGRIASEMQMLSGAALPQTPVSVSGTVVQGQLAPQTISAEPVEPAPIFFELEQ